MADSSLTKGDILSLIRGAADRLTELGVRSIGLFGSFVRGDASDQSDVDLLVEFEPDKKTFDNFIEACFLLEDLLGRRVELVTAESMSPYIGPYVEKEVEYVQLST